MNRNTSVPFPTPRPIGIFSICAAALGFTVGLLRKEPVLPLAGTVFIVCLAYCFLSIFFLGLIHRKKAAALSVRMIPERINVNKNGTMQLSQKVYFFQMPAILIRYKLMLSTKDNKKIESVFDGDFFKKMTADFQTVRRGAYYGMYDNLIIQDIFGFFCCALKVPQGKNERLLVLPAPAETFPPALPLSGGLERRSENSIHRTDDLTEQRPYIPGDDPRRINWKLYSHAGELFVRQEDREPPPHSEFILLIDTEAGSELYPGHEGPAAVDALCSAALTLLMEKAASGAGVLLGFTGGEIRDGNAAELSAMLAYPVFGEPDGGSRLPPIPAFSGTRNVMILALGRRQEQGFSGIHDFIAKQQIGQTAQIVFFYNNEKQKNYAEASAIIFNRFTGVKASTARYDAGLYKI
ncbi:MAG: DUF58 domain-containing protein [Treponema sp.]|jgi:uncharacterized protein (DUF58 family)|nr:DUF58 domain-containing protein [Treponema sp.]